MASLAEFEASPGPEVVDVFDEPEEVLRKILSPLFRLCVIPDVSLVRHCERIRSAAWRERAAEQPPWAMTVTECHYYQAGFRAIGSGSCGKVYEQHGTSDVLKKATSNGALPPCGLWNDYIMHMKVEKAFEAYRVLSKHETYIHVPRCSGYISQNDGAWWAVNERLFPKDSRFPADVLRSERIPPIHLVARHALINEYCPERLKVDAMLRDSYKDCLIRVYLGKHRDTGVRCEERIKDFDLGNFELCLDQILGLGVDPVNYVLSMADALAVMHWQARIDAAGVKFVLGGASCLAQERLTGLRSLESMGQGASTFLGPVQYQSAPTHMWLFDFNRCQSMSMDENGVFQAVRRFVDNRSYYPNPRFTKDSFEHRLWWRFVKGYLSASKYIVDADEERRALPQRFIHKVLEAFGVRVKSEG